MAKKTSSSNKGLGATATRKRGTGLRKGSGLTKMAKKADKLSSKKLDAATKNSNKAVKLKREARKVANKDGSGRVFAAVMSGKTPEKAREAGQREQKKSLKNNPKTKQANKAAAASKKQRATAKMAARVAKNLRAGTRRAPRRK